ncbi:MAG: hypothetical protein ACOCRX_00915 [Candidatus Woesearchaeota archaeon]
MKFKIIFLTTIILISFIGCAKPKDDKSFSDIEIFGDNSDKSPIMYMTDNEYKIKLNKDLIPLKSSHGILFFEGKKLKQDITNKDIEIKRTKDLIKKTNDFRTILTERKSKLKNGLKEKNDNIIKAIDNYVTKLREYKLLLEDEKIDKSVLNTIINQLNSSFENITYYSK